jgi:hypothetical protein
MVEKTVREENKKYIKYINSKIKEAKDTYEKQKIRREAY